MVPGEHDGIGGESILDEADSFHVRHYTGQRAQPKQLVPGKREKFGLVAELNGLRIADELEKRVPEVVLVSRIKVDMAGVKELFSSAITLGPGTTCSVGATSAVPSRI